MHPLKITVVTTSYNQADYVEETLRSVLDQNYTNLEYIVMDGGSTDGSVEIIEKYSDQLTYWISEKDGGQSDALNKGFERATGDIFCWVNSDDFLAPNALNIVANYFKENPDWQVINGGCRMIAGKNGDTSDESSIRHLKCSAEEALANWSGNWFAQPSTFWRSRLWREVGPLRNDLHFTMDFELWSRFAAQTKFHSVPELLAEYRFHESAKCIAEHGAKSMEMFRLTSEGAPAEAMPFLVSAKQLFHNLASEYDTQNAELKKMIKTNAEQQALIAMQHEHIESFKNSRWIRVGGCITKLLNFRGKATRSKPSN